MRKSIIFFGLITVLLCSSVSAKSLEAQKYKLGLGLIFSEQSATGLCAKMWTGTTTAIDGAVAWSSGDVKFVNLHFDYLMHNSDVLSMNEKTFFIYYGIGTRFKFIADDSIDKDTKIGIRIPLGISYLFLTAPCDVFFEAVPVLDFTDGSEMNVNASVGVRYYFQ